jgi:hypothetical protein
MTVDAEWRGSAAAASHPLHALHLQLYARSVKHATRVYYALVCRVALGTPARTRDGLTRLDGGAPLFADAARTTLAGREHALLAEVGGRVARFREFVVIDPAAVTIEYLVALKRVRHYCSCGVPATVRTVTKSGLNAGRIFLFCGQQQDAKTCDFKQMLPVCLCNKSAEVKVKKDGGLYYACGSRRDWCTFTDWHGPQLGGHAGVVEAGSGGSQPQLKRKQPAGGSFSPAGHTHKR